MIPLRIWPWELSRQFHVYWVFALAVLGFTSAFLRLWKLAALNSVLLAVLTLPVLPYYFPKAPASPAASGVLQSASDSTPEEFRLISFNLLRLRREASATVAALDKADPDMLLLLEFTGGWQRELAPVLGKYHWRIGVPQPDSFGIWFGSKFPLDFCRIEVVGDGPFPTVVARARIGNRTLGFTGAHPMNPVAPSATGIWQEQFTIYTTLVSESGGDCQIFAGDLNCTPFALAFREFQHRTGLRQTALGRGLTNTWHGPYLPFRMGLPIDHILVSAKIQVLDLKAGPTLGSDHRWLEARLKLTD